MSNHYLLPVCFAAAAHGALLFGFTKHPRPAQPEEKTFYTRFEIPQPKEDPPEIVDTDQSKSESKAAIEAPLPRAAEPLTIPDPGQVTMTPPQLPPINTGDVRTVFDGLPIGKPGADKSGWGKVVTDAMLDNPPRTRFQSTPLYPHEAKHSGMRGEVVVEFIVDERGRVIEPRVVRSSDRVFEESTLRAVTKWQFEPGRRGGKIVSFRMSVPVVFKLTD